MPQTDVGSGAIAGIDGIPHGWIAAVLSADGSTWLELLSSLGDLIARDFRLAIVDIPIGLPDALHRTCDREARRLIGLRRNSVFPAPLRAMLDAADYETACRIRLAAQGTRCSRQLFAILPKIREADEILCPQRQASIREGHPELSFTIMNAGTPMRLHKALPDGHIERRDLVRRCFPDCDDAMTRLGRPDLAIDALDAYALLWSAKRAISGGAVVIPELAETDARGLRAEMVA